MIFSAEYITLQVVAAVVAAILIKLVGLSKNLPRLTAIAVVLMFLTELFMMFRYDAGITQFAVTCVRESCPKPVSQRLDSVAPAQDMSDPVVPGQDTSPLSLSAAKAPEQFGFVDIFRVGLDRLNRDSTEIAFTTSGEWMKETRQIVVQEGAYAIFGSNDGQNWGGIVSTYGATISGLTYEKFEGITPPFLYICTASPLEGENRLLVVEETHQLTSDKSAYVLVRPRSYSYAGSADQCSRRSLSRYIAPEKPNPVGQAHEGDGLLEIVVPKELSGALTFSRSSGTSAYGPRFGPVQLGGQMSLTVKRLKEEWPDMQATDIAVHGLDTPVVAIRRSNSTQLLVLFGRDGVDQIAGYSLVTNTFPETPTFVDLRERLAQKFGPPLHVDGFGGGTQAAAWTASTEEACAKSGQRITWTNPRDFDAGAHPYLYLRRDWPGTTEDACNIYISLVATDTPHVSQFDLTIANTRYLNPP